MREFWDLLLSAYHSYNPAHVIATLVGLFVFVTELILFSKGIILSSGDKRLKEAIEKGNIITGHQVSISFTDKDKDSGGFDRLWTASYEYEFKGRKRRKIVSSNGSRPGVTITLYHDGSKVYTEHEMRKHTQSFLVIIIFPLVITFAVAYLLQ